MHHPQPETIYMTPLLSIFEAGDHTLYTIIGLLLVVSVIYAIRQQGRISLLEHQLDLIFRQQKGEDILSPEAKLMAKDPAKKIAAIRLHRDQNPGLTIVNAKWDVENLS